MAAKKAVTMQSIADELGISKVTVSKALNGKEGVSEDLKEKIFRLAREKGYILPDYGQRRMRKAAIVMNGRFASPRDGSRFYLDMYEKIMAELMKSSCSCMLLPPGRESLAGDIARLGKKGNFDGLIILGFLEPEVLEQVEAIALPKVYVDVYDKTRRSDSVVGENFYSAYEMTEYLMRMGHRKIGFVGTAGATTSITDRYLGYVRALAEQGIAPRDDWRVPDRSMEGEAVELMLPAELPDAFFCNCDETAFRLVRRLRERGLRVPEDISVAGFNNDVYSRLCEPALTTVEVDMEKLGRAVAKRFLRRIECPGQKSGGVFRIEGKLIIRESVGKRERKE